MARFTPSAAAAFLISISLSAFVHAASRPSGTPSCFVCQPEDDSGVPLGVHSDSYGVLFCSYPSLPDQDPNVFFCTYRDYNGHLIQDHNQGLCPRTAASVSCATRRDDNFKAMKRLNEARAAQPQTSRSQARSNPLKKKRSDYTVKRN